MFKFLAQKVPHTQVVTLQLKDLMISKNTFKIAYTHW